MADAATERYKITNVSLVSQAGVCVCVCVVRVLSFFFFPFANVKSMLASAAAACRGMEGREEEGQYPLERRKGEKNPPPSRHAGSAGDYYF